MPTDYPQALFLRLHHRSSVFGAIDEGEADSNVYVLGLRRAF